MKIFPIKLKLREKTLLFSLLIVIFPFVISNVFWYFNAQENSSKTAKSNMVAATQEAAAKINSFLNTKLLGFFSHSQNAALLSGNAAIIQEDLLNFLQQDPDISSITYVDALGNEIVKVDRNKVYPKTDLKNIKESPEFKIATFRYGKEYISQAHFSEGKKPEITIAVPVVFPDNSSSLLTFSSVAQNQRKPGEIYGTVIGTVSLARFGQDATSIKIGQNGYIYIIDRNGFILAHPNINLIGRQNTGETSKKINDLLSKEALGDTVIQPYKANSLGNVPILTTFSSIQRTGWAAIAEEPLSDISSDIARIQMQAALLFLLPLSLAFFLSYLFSKRLISPIQEMVKGTESVGKGNFDYNFSVKTGDELEQLANEYHKMAQNLKHDRSSLVAEKDTLSTVLGNIADGVIALSEKYDILFFNQSASKITGLKSEDAIGKEIDRALSIKGEGDINFEKLCRESRTGLFSHVVTLSIGDKQSKTLQVIVASLNASLVSEIRYIITFYDISKEQELEEMKIDFVSMAAHELRTPLTAIRGYSKMLDDEVGAKLNKEQNQFLKRIITSVANLSNLVDNLLNASRIEKGTLQLDLQLTDMNELSMSTVQNLQQVAKNKNQTLTWVKSKENVPSVLVDKFRIEEVLTNLIANAINYTPERGKITVSTQKKAEDVIVAVTDTGEGIPKNAIPNLFTKFFRVGGKLEQGSKGTGLGLFITKEILNLHKGKIWVESVLGKGSTFTFSLPIASSLDIEKAEGKQSESTTKGFFINPDRKKPKIGS